MKPPDRDKLSRELKSKAKSSILTRRETDYLAANTGIFMQSFPNTLLCISLDFNCTKSVYRATMKTIECILLYNESL